MAVCRQKSGDIVYDFHFNIIMDRYRGLNFFFQFYGKQIYGMHVNHLSICKISNCNFGRICASISVWAQFHIPPRPFLDRISHYFDCKFFNLFITYI